MLFEVLPSVVTFYTYRIRYLLLPPIRGSLPEVIGMVSECAGARGTRQDVASGVDDE